MWREFISERHCKRELIKYLANIFLDIPLEQLKGHQNFVTACGFDDPARNDKTLMCSQSMKGSLQVEISALASNHEETDSRAWLHALTGSTNNVWIFSPDTDTYHRGFPLLGRNSKRKVVVQLSKTYYKHEFLFLNQLIDCMYRDASVAHLAGIDILKVFQHIFVCEAS